MIHLLTLLVVGLFAPTYTYAHNHTLATCPSSQEKYPEDICSSEFRDMITSNHENLISAMQEALDSLDDIDLDNFTSTLSATVPAMDLVSLREDLETSINSTRTEVESAFCVFNNTNDEMCAVINDICSEKRTALFYNEQKRALTAPDTPKQGCTTNALDKISYLRTGLEVATQTVWGMDYAQDTSSELGWTVGFAGFVVAVGTGGGLLAVPKMKVTKAAAIGFSFSEVAARVVISGLSIAIDRLTDENGECVFNTVKTIHDLSFKQFERLDGQVKVVDRKLDIIDTNNDENQSILQNQVAPHLHSLVLAGTNPGAIGQRKLQVQQHAKADNILQRAGCDGIDNDGDSILLGVPVNNPTATVPPTSDDTSTVIIREGLVDECDEDQVAPTITLMRIPPETFQDEQEVIDWYENEDNVKFADDCAASPALGLSTRIDGDMIIVRVEDSRCSPVTLGEDRVEAVNDQKNNNAIVQNVIVDTSGAYAVERSFEFELADTVPPVVTCGFQKHQDIYHVINPPPGGFIPDGTMNPPFPDLNLNEPLHIDARNEDGQTLVDVGFFYQITDDSTTDINVDITLFSNEYENSLTDMYEFIERNDLANPIVVNPTNPDFVHRAMLFLSPFSCKSETRRNEGLESRGNICVTEDNGQNNDHVEFPITTRFYDIIVKATDAAGNEAETSCTVIVVPDDLDHYPHNKPSASPSTKGKGKGKGKGKVHPPHTRPDDLVAKYNISQKRFKIGSFSHVWDFALSNAMTLPPTASPTASPTPGKGKGKGNRERQLNLKKVRDEQDY